MNATALYRSPSGNVELIFPYRREMVEALKAAVPGYARSWNPILKVWTIFGGFQAVAVQLLFAYFPDATTVHLSDLAGDEPLRAARTVATNDPDRETLYVTRDAPPEVVAAAYRALSKLFHPDRGGNHQRMQEINAAYSRVTERLEARGAA